MLKYTHRQKLSNSKLVWNIKNCFVPKILEIQVLLHVSSFDFIRIEYQYNWQMYYVTSVKLAYIEEGCAFSLYEFDFSKGVYFKSYFAPL